MFIFKGGQALGLWMHMKSYFGEERSIISIVDELVCPITCNWFEGNCKVKYAGADMQINSITVKILLLFSMLSNIFTGTSSGFTL